MDNYDIVGLYPHNIKSYKKIKEAFQKQNIVAIVHSTGTGKSYNAIQYIYDNPNKKILYVVPSNSIIEHIKEIINGNPNLDLKKDFKNVEFKTYQSLSILKPEELDTLDIDILILDEFHHIGAPVWGEAVNKIIESHKKIKILGMSAYTIRNRGTSKQRDMIESDSEELFSNAVVSNYDLCDAMVDGVLPKPIYKSAYVHLEDTYKFLEQKINKLDHNSYNYNLLHSLMVDIRNKIHEAPSMKDVFKENIKKNGKYIYFCPVMYEKEVSDINTIIKEVKSWIYEMGLKEDEFELYTTTSMMGNEGLKNRNAFYNDKDLDGKDASKKLRIMFAINQYNEGVHVPGIDGVIMGRTTNSDIIYFEQLGRALSARGNVIEDYNLLKDKTVDELITLCKEKGIITHQTREKDKLIELLLSPVVIDLANNIEYIQELEHGLCERINDNQFIRTKNNSYKITPSFDTSMINEDLYQILQYIKERIVIKWEDYYNMAVEYYNHNHDLNIKCDFKTINGYEYDPNGYKLGSWIIQQRVYKKNNNLSNERIRKLNEIEMIWATRLDWMGMYNLAKKFYNKIGNLNIPKKWKTINGYEYDPNGYSLGQWLYAQKNLYNKNCLNYSQKKIELLENIGIDWNRENDYYINAFFEAKLDYCKRNNLNMKEVSDEEYEGVPHSVLMRNYVSLEENIEEEETYDMYDVLMNSDLKDKLNEILDTLNEREKDVIIHVFGLNNEPIYMETELAEKYGVVPQAISLVKKRALQKLRKHVNVKKIKDFHTPNYVNLSVKEQLKLETHHECDLLVEVLFDFKYNNMPRLVSMITSLCNYYYKIEEIKLVRIIDSNRNKYWNNIRCSYFYANNIDLAIKLFNEVLDDIKETALINKYSFRRERYSKAKTKNLTKQ